MVHAGALRGAPTGLMVYCGGLQLVRMLLISGADIRCRNVSPSSNQLLKLLLDCWLGQDEGWNVLMIAAARGNQKLEVLQLLLQ